MPKEHFSNELTPFDKKIIKILRKNEQYAVLIENVAEQLNVSVRSVRHSITKLCNLDIAQKTPYLIDLRRFQYTLKKENELIE